jgi:hypothetical protein
LRKVPLARSLRPWSRIEAAGFKANTAPRQQEVPLVDFASPAGRIDPILDVAELSFHGADGAAGDGHVLSAANGAGAADDQAPPRDRAADFGACDA